MQAFHANWNYPTSISVGENRTTELPDVCRQLSIRKPLLVTDSGLLGLPAVKSLIDLCTEQNLELGVFSEVKSNPDGANVEQGVVWFHKGQHDGVIAVGGGSVIDAAKAIALMVGQDRPLWDFEDIGDHWQRVCAEKMVPVVAIPTTAGTGSEVGRASVITHAQAQRKVIIFHPNMLPKHVILDPLLTLGLPAGLTAATGMDALSHSLEAYCANGYHPMAEGIAMQAIELIRDYLPRAYREGYDTEARLQMLVASSMGATAFQRGLGGMHAIAHTLGALYGAHHGLLNAILMPYVLKANQHAISERIARLARYLNLPEASFNSFLAWILRLREDLGIPHSLCEIEIDDQQAEKIGQMSAADPSAGGNPVAFSATQYRAIFESALSGQLDRLNNGL